MKCASWLCGARDALSDGGCMKFTSDIAIAHCIERCKFAALEAANYQEARSLKHEGALVAEWEKQFKESGQYGAPLAVATKKICPDCSCSVDADGLCSGCGRQAI